MRDDIFNETQRLRDRTWRLFNLQNQLVAREVGKITPVVVLENDRLEDRLHGGEVTFVAHASIAADAANATQLGILIPADTNVLVTVEEMSLTIPTTQPVFYRREYSVASFVNAGLGGVAADTRQGSSRLPAVQIVERTPHGALAGTLGFEVKAGERLRSDNGVFVMAGSKTANVAWWMDVNVINTLIRGVFRWRERIQEGGFLS